MATEKKRLQNIIYKKNIVVLLIVGSSDPKGYTDETILQLPHPCHTGLSWCSEAKDNMMKKKVKDKGRVRNSSSEQVGSVTKKENQKQGKIERS